MLKVGEHYKWGYSNRYNIYEITFIDEKIDLVCWKLIAEYGKPKLGKELGKEEGKYSLKSWINQLESGDKVKLLKYTNTPLYRKLEGLKNA